MQNGVACPDSYYRKAVAEYSREVSSLSLSLGFQPPAASVTIRRDCSFPNRTGAICDTRKCRRNCGTRY